jgi:hypothetical protein
VCGVRWATGGRARDGQPPTSFKKEEEEGTCDSSFFFTNKIIYRRRGARISGNSHDVKNFKLPNLNYLIGKKMIIQLQTF